MLRGVKMEKILQVEKLYKTYGKGSGATQALKGISFYVLSGEFVGIMGPSGSGKTTLLNCIATVIQPSAGQVLIKNENLSTFFLAPSILISPHNPRHTNAAPL